MSLEPDAGLLPDYKIRRFMEALGPNPEIFDRGSLEIDEREDYGFLVAHVLVRWPEPVGVFRQWAFCLSGTGGIFIGYGVEMLDGNPASVKQTG